MPARVMLSVVCGRHISDTFIFEERTTCIVGRAEDCTPIRVPKDEAHRAISRHHCLLDINPPDIRIRDFGSRNGTFVNGKLIGKRETVKPGPTPEFPEVDLKHGDEIRLQQTVYRVEIFVPAVCSQCGQEIPEHETQVPESGGQDGGGQDRVCQACLTRRKALAQVVRTAKSSKRCCACGSDVTGPIDERRQGALLCHRCQANPQELVKHLLELAETGDASLGPIRGYTILKELGRGGMGAVYLARHAHSGEQVALKLMLPQVALEPIAQERFLRETVNTQALRHPHVVSLRDSGCSQGTFFFTLEYCDGGSVDRLVKQRGGTLPIDEAVPLICQVLDGLAYAHQAEIPYVKLADGSIGRGRGLVHRDLKPGNIFLAGSGPTRVAKVGDYGLAKAFDTAGLSGQTSTGSLAGTPKYMPRQQVLNFKESRPEVDVWACAASLYAMLTGTPPRDFPANADPWLTVLSTSAVPIRQRKPNIPPKLAEAIDRALVDKPQIEVRSAAELKRLLLAAV